MMEIWEAADVRLSAAVAEPHWYLDMVAVDPARQGAGIGGALLRAVHARADAAGWPTALRTFRPRNRPFYQWHGYEAVATGSEPTAGLDFWGFRRAPRATHG
jgi:GNAT superfamily N-acetyltransferase